MNLKVILAGLKQYYRNAEEVEKIIVDCALVAAAAGTVGGIIPGLAIAGLIVSCFGAVWVMYAKICTCLGIRLSENLLKVVASAVLSNIAANLAGAFAAEIVFSFIPGAAMIANATLTFCTVYLAGLMFTKILLAFAKKGKYGDDLESVTEESFKDAVNGQSVSKDDLKAAKDAYKREKD